MMNFCDRKKQEQNPEFNKVTKMKLNLKNSLINIPLLTGVFFLSGALMLSSCSPPSGQGQQRETQAGNQQSGNPAWGRGGGGAPRQQTQFLAPVLAERVRRGPVEATVSTTGEIVPIRTRMLRTEESGRLHFTQPWNEGDFVEKGTVIARIHSEALEGELMAAMTEVRISEENLAIGRKSMESAIREYETVQDLYVRGISALREVETQKLNMDRAINTHEQNQINLENSKAKLKRVEERLERLEVLAPFDGLLVSANTLQGQTTFSATFGNETITDFDGRMISTDFNVVGIVDTSKVLIRSDITSKDIGKILVGQHARASIYSTENLEVLGEVVRISNSMNTSTRAFQIEILADNPGLELKPGMFGRLDVITERRLDTISVDKSVITRRNNRDVVFVALEPDGEEGPTTSREVPVTIGLQGRDTVEIEYGLQENDILIVRGFEILQDRTPINVIFADEPVVPQADQQTPPVDREERQQRGRRTADGQNRPPNPS